MEKQIKAVLSGLPDVKVEQVANLWRVKIGGLSGAREDGVGLARELRAKYEYIRARERPVPVDIPVEIPAFMTFPDDPEPEPEAIRTDPRDEEIAALKAKLAEMEAVKAEEVPDEVSETLAEFGVGSADSYERVNATLVAALTKAKGSAELARSYGGMFDGKSVVEWERKAQAINESVRWNSGRKVETI